MEDKNIKRINEALKEIAEAQQDTDEFNRAVEMDIDKINRALLYGYLQPVITQYFASNKSEIWS